MEHKSVSKSVLARLPLYLGYLRSLGEDAPQNISARAIAQALGLGEVQVRKDLASVSSGGRPKVGYQVPELVSDLETFLGFKDLDDAIIVGAGKLGRALLDYDGFHQYGMNLVAAFDQSCREVCQTESGKRIFPMDKLPDLCVRMNIRIGVITVPASAAQQVCDLLVACGVEGILNFAPIHLKAPEGVVIHNENIATSLALVSKNLKDKLYAK